jgi:hypothetical protein
MRVDGMDELIVHLLTNVRNQPEARISVMTVTCRTVRPMIHIIIKIMVTVMATVINTTVINTTINTSIIRVSEKLVTKRRLMRLMTVNPNIVDMLIITIMMITIWKDQTNVWFADCDVIR